MLKLLVASLKTNQFFLQNANMLFQFKILFVQYSFVLFNSFKQGIADSFLSDHDAFFIDWDEVVSFCWWPRVPICAGIMRNKRFDLSEWIERKLEIVFLWKITINELYFCLLGSQKMVRIHHNRSDCYVGLNRSFLHFSIFSNLRQIGVLILLVNIFIRLRISVDDGLDVISLLVNITFLISNENFFALEDHIRHLNFYDFNPLNRHLHNFLLRHATLLLQNRWMVGLILQAIALF